MNTAEMNHQSTIVQGEETLDIIIYSNIHSPISYHDAVYT